MLDIGLRYDEIPQRTFPQIQALLSGWEEIASIKIGMPNIFGNASVAKNTQEQIPTKPPKLSQFMEFANMFNT